jgi:hypothetical protein
VRLVRIDASSDYPHWGWMEQLLRPAIVRGKRTPGEVLEALRRGIFEAVTLHFDGGAMVLVASKSLDGDRPVVLIRYVGGATTLKPKAWLRQLKAILAELETIMRRRGYRELRFGGRNWPVPGYEHYSKEHPTWVRKVLTDG